MKSIYGKRGAICVYFGWTWEYLTKGIAWGIVERMLADQSRYDEGKETAKKKFDDEPGEIELTEDNAEEFIKYINSI